MGLREPAAGSLERLGCGGGHAVGTQAEPSCGRRGEEGEGRWSCGERKGQGLKAAGAADAALNTFLQVDLAK